MIPQKLASQRQRRFLVPAIAILAATIPPGLHAADWSDRCDAALLPQISIESSTTEVKIAWLSLVTEDNYEQAKAGGGLNIILEGLPIGASYQQFSEKRREFLSRQELQFEKAEARARFSQSLSPAQLEAWTTCMTSDKPGVRILLKTQSDREVAAEVFYLEAPGRSKRFRLSVTGGQLAGSAASSRIRLNHGGTAGVLIQRKDPQAKITLQVNGRNMTDTVVSLPKPETPPPPRDCTEISLLSAKATATASRNPGGAPNVTDGCHDSSCAWNSMGPAPAWIQIDLGGQRRVRQIVVNPEQTPAGATQHRITGWGEANQTPLLLAELNTVTISGGLTTIVIAGNTGDGIRFVRIETVASPSWVAWREIEVRGCR
ncbi:MAG: discoidin domain-containing protein [Thermoanaerobaculia bacterium]|nr:discoidin domain-containing protein [Thermoanaerobaculia bacterium]